MTEGGMTLSDATVGRLSLLVTRYCCISRGSKGFDSLCLNILQELNYKKLIYTVNACHDFSLLLGL